MLDIIGNIKLKSTTNETIEERLNYLLMVIDGFSYLSKDSKIYLNVDNSEYIDIIKNNLIKNNFDFELTNETDYFDNIYINFLQKSDKKYIQHFEEDHISICDDINYINKILKLSNEYNVDLIKATFYQLEINSHSNVPPIYEDDLCKIMRMNLTNYNIINKIEKRFYIGTNCIFNKEFAIKFWSRDLKSYSPHPYEIRSYDIFYEHTLMVPKKEILCAFNDDHGILNSCYLKRKDIKK